MLVAAIASLAVCSAGGAPPGARPAPPASVAQQDVGTALPPPAVGRDSAGPAPQVPLLPQGQPAAVPEDAGPPARGTLGPPVPIASRHLGYTVNVRVYEPPPSSACGSLPVLYVTDGSDYWKPQLGNLVETLDALISSGRISPIVAIFVDAWDPVARRNRRYEQFLPAGTETREPFASCPFCDFLVEEVIPLVEARFEVDGDRRGILGSSLGGFNAALMALDRPDLFRVVGIQSPSIWRQPWFARRVASAPSMPARVAIEVGDRESLFLPGARALRDAYASRGIPLQYREVRAGHSWDHWRESVAEVLVFLYAPR